MAEDIDLVKGVVDAADGVVKATNPQDLPRNLDFLLDVFLQVSVEVGRTKMTIQDLLQLGQGSVIELSKLAGEPLDIYINERLVARGEAVIVNEKFGVRITDIISQQERLESLA
jgi:flagellar motor switch protein FliN